MEEAKIYLSRIYLATSPLLDSEFEGEVVRKNIHTCILKVINCSLKDKQVVADLQGMMVVKYSHIRERDTFTDC